MAGEPGSGWAGQGVCLELDWVGTFYPPTCCLPPLRPSATLQGQRSSCLAHDPGLHLLAALDLGLQRLALLPLVARGAAGQQAGGAQVPD